MLRVNECHLKIGEKKEHLQSVIAKKLKTKNSFDYHIVKESIDARKNMRMSYCVDVLIENEEKYLHLKDVMKSSSKPYEMPKYKSFSNRPIIIGMGPSSLFCALLLAKCHARPIIFERGSCVEKRMKDVELFFKEGKLNPSSNVQFGEGGAGTFSDGKLTSRSKDPRSYHVLEEFVHYGADPAILYEAYPHIGTDVLVDILKRMREEILNLGGEIYFDHQLEDLYIENQTITQIKVNGKWMKCSDLLIGCGHSARDTFRMLHQHHVAMEAKNFAVGVRIEHPQQFVDQTQYKEYADKLPHASYRLTHTTASQRGVYTFCMCPGGEVIMAASGLGQVVTNGMSYHARDKQNANSALLVQVYKEDLRDDLFAGVEFQEKLEKKAFEMGGSNYQAPSQLASDYLKNQKSFELRSVQPSYPLGVRLTDLNELFDDFINEALHEGLLAFDQKMPGFIGDAVLTGVESRSTSPLRILRNESLTSINVHNLYPMGEGAGYAGGIVSAAIDGLKCAEMWMKKRGSL